jgi:hypothetical protein
MNLLADLLFLRRGAAGLGYAATLALQNLPAFPAARRSWWPAPVRR